MSCSRPRHQSRTDVVLLLVSQGLAGEVLGVGLLGTQGQIIVLIRNTMTNQIRTVSPIAEYD